MASEPMKGMNLTKSGKVGLGKLKPRPEVAQLVEYRSLPSRPLKASRKLRETLRVGATSGDVGLGMPKRRVAGDVGVKVRNSRRAGDVGMKVRNSRPRPVGTVRKPRCAGDVSVKVKPMLAGDVGMKVRNSRPRPVGTVRKPNGAGDVSVKV